MGLLRENISELDALDFVITAEFLKSEGFEMNMHRSYVKTIKMKNKTGHVFYRLFFCEKRLFIDYPHIYHTGDIRENCDYVFFGPEIYNHGLGKYISLGGLDQFDDIAFKSVITIREYFDMLKYLEERAQLF